MERIAQGFRRLTGANTGGRLLRRFFDVADYRRRYPDVAAAGVDPLKHYLREGWWEGRQPNAWFHPSIYRAANPGLTPDDIDPFGVFLARAAREAGRLDDRAALIALGGFDAAYYRRFAPEAGDDPLTHFMARGWRAGLDPSPDFSVSFYLRRHLDVAESGENPLVHYLRAGRNEGREAASVADEAVFAQFECDPVMAARVAAAITLDPIVRRPEGPRTVVSPLAHRREMLETVEAIRKAAGPGRRRFLIVAADLEPTTETTRAALAFATAAAARAGAAQVLVATTEADGGAAAALPAGVELVDISSRLGGLHDEDRRRCLVDLIRGVGAEAVVNFNSRLASEAFALFGRQLAQETLVASFVSAPDHDADDGAARLRDAANAHHLFFAADPALAQAIAMRFGLSEDETPVIRLEEGAPRLDDASNAVFTAMMDRHGL